jgi:hypothetical protein
MQLLVSSTEVQNKKMNISDLKKELQTLGLSLATPGLTGDERYEELKFRLEKAKGKYQSVLANVDSSENNCVPLEGMDFSLLTIGELRSRLTSLGISTATPGLSGQERWLALKQRLMDAICVSVKDEEDIDEEQLDPIRNHQKEVKQESLPFENVEPKSRKPVITLSLYTFSY